MGRANGADTQGAQPAQGVKPQRKKSRTLGIVLQVVAMAAIGMLVYPEAASWVARIGHNAEISGYVQQVDGTSPEERQRILDAAYAYNDVLQPGPLTDPYISQNEDEARQSDIYLAYEEMLRVSGTNAIGTINFPRLDIGVPLYHGTSDEVISKGAGHMYGTSLPVGGPSTHSVLTAHSGLPHSKLFTNLPKAKVGDPFWISVLGEDHHYRVVKTETVLPGETDSLEIRQGEDIVTLFTCTPIGVNSHRFMVHAERLPDSEVTDGALSGDGMKLGFPWWAVWFVGGSAAVWWILFAPPTKRRKKEAKAS